jgi:hypothetical protein
MLISLPAIVVVRPPGAIPRLANPNAAAERYPTMGSPPNETVADEKLIVPRAIAMDATRVLEFARTQAQPLRAWNTVTAT